MDADGGVAAAMYARCAGLAQTHWDCVATGSSTCDSSALDRCLRENEPVAVNDMIWVGQRFCVAEDAQFRMCHAGTRLRVPGNPNDGRGKSSASGADVVNLDPDVGSLAWVQQSAQAWWVNLMPAPVDDTLQAPKAECQDLYQNFLRCATRTRLKYVLDQRAKRAFAADTGSETVAEDTSAEVKTQSDEKNPQGFPE